MMATLIDFRLGRAASPGDHAGLQCHLAQLIGEPFQFARISYGDELTLHFGDLRPGKSPKSRGRLYGEYALGLRASHWLLKSGSEPMLMVGDPSGVGNATGDTLRKEQLEANPLIHPGSLVVSVRPYPVLPMDTLGLHLQTSDGSRLVVGSSRESVDEPGDAPLPELADWELLSPAGLLSAGPGPNWSFKPAAATSAAGPPRTPPTRTSSGTA